MRIKYARKLSSLFMWLLCVQLLGGHSRYAFVLAVMINPPRTAARKCSLGCFAFVQERLILKICQNLYWLIVFHILILGPGALSEGAKPTKAPPWRRDWIRLNCRLVMKLEMMYIGLLQAQVWTCISAHPGVPHQKTKRETNDASKSQLKQASCNRTVLKFASENHATVIIFQLFFVTLPWKLDLGKVTSLSV